MLSYRSYRLITFCVFIVFLGLHLAAFSSAYWFKRRDIYGWLVHHGLWVLCDTYRAGGKDNQCLRLVNRYDDFENGKLRAVQTLMSMSLICHVIVSVLFTLWLICSEKRLRTDQSKRIGYVGFMLCTFSGLLTLISVAIFGVYYAKFEHVLNWSYILATVSGGVLFIGGIVGFIILLRASFDELERESANQRRLPPLTARDPDSSGLKAGYPISSVYSKAEFGCRTEKDVPRLTSRVTPYPKAMLQSVHDEL